MALEDASGGAQEELLDDRAVARAGAAGGNGGRGGAGYVDPYAWERPLDAVNRHSRLMDAEPVLAGTAFGSDTRRLSRLPPGVSMVDPFGFNLTSDVSPYDLAAFSQSPPTAGTNALSRSSPVRSSFLGPGYQPTMTASPQINPRLSGMSGTSAASSSAAASTAAATSPATSPGTSEHAFALQNGAPQPPWLKPRASSAGEQGGPPRSQVRNGLLAPGLGGMPPRGVSQRSKLSGEIEADAMSITSTTSRQTSSALPPSVPTDSDYLNSKLYQRTLRAQKALEKERAKAASRGKLSRYDEEASKSTGSLHLGFGLGRRSSVDSSRPPSIMSAVGVAGSTGRRSGRKSLGWFRSSSEAALTLSSPAKEELAPPALPASKSSSQISALGAGRRSPSSGGSSSLGGGSGIGVVGAGGSSGPGSGAVTPLPPSPNLPSEATLRAMGVSTDQLRAAAQAQPPPPSPRGTGPAYPSAPSPPAASGVPQRPRSGGRSASGGKSPRTSVQPSMPPVPPSPTEPIPPEAGQYPPSQPKTTALPLVAPFQQPRPVQIQAPPVRKASLEPPPTAAIPSVSPAPAQGQVPVPPRTASRPAQSQQPQLRPENVPLPPSAATTPIGGNFPLSSGAPTSRQPSLLQPTPPSTAAPQAQARPSPAHPYPQTQSTSSSQRSLPAGAAPAQPSPAPTSTPSAQPTPAPAPAPAPALAAPTPAEPQVKRRKSGFGLLFGGGGSSSGRSTGTASERSSIASASTATAKATSREGSPAPGPGAAAEKDKMMQRIKERQEIEARGREREKRQQEEQAKKKLTRKDTNGGGGGGFFGFGSGSAGANKLRSSGGPSKQQQHQPAPSAAKAPPPPPGARPPERQKSQKKEKKEDVPFFHPSQALYASRQPESAQPPRAPQPPMQANPQYSPLAPSSPSEAQIRAINASPPVQHPPSPNPTGAFSSQHPSHPIAAQHQQYSPRNDSSSGSSTTFSSLSSSSSTLPPPTPANAPVNVASPLGLGTHSINKKSGFASFFSMGGNGGSLRGRTKSSPSSPPPGLRQQQQLGAKTLPGLPSPPPPVANGTLLAKPPRGQSLGLQQQGPGQDGQSRLASQKPYATYA
ncbi:hypothetical protein JCM11251_004193 [Rhodosporidiobolus azoricus]